MLSLPPLEGLRFFEAAARHESFKHAATELGVTPAAVGYRIRALEQHLDAELFDRHQRGVNLNRHGRAYLTPRLPPGRGRGPDVILGHVEPTWDHKALALDKKMGISMNTSSDNPSCNARAWIEYFAYCLAEHPMFHFSVTGPNSTVVLIVFVMPDSAITS